MMWGFSKALAVTATVVSSIIGGVSAQTTSTSSATPSTSTANAATYIYNDGSSSNFTFTITQNPANKEFWFWMAAPSTYSWIAVGSGSGMKGSTMFIAYEGVKDNSIILSSRKSTDEVEPSYERIGLTTLNPNNAAPTIKDDTFVVGGYCNSTCANQAGIDPTKKLQPFIFAVGPEFHDPRSDDFAAPLRRHALYGYFQLDMTQAHGTTDPKGVGKQSVGASGASSKTDHEFSSSGHAFAMGLAFVVIFPLGIFFLRILEKVSLHMYAQSFGFFLVIIGTISGFVVSRSYNRSKNFNNPHQIVGILLFLLIVAQWVFGFLHHRSYKRTQLPTWMIKPHKFVLGPLVMVLGIVNAAFGFKFALAPQENYFYVPIVIAMVILMVVAFTLKKFFLRKRKNRNVPFGGPMPTGPSPYVAPGAGYPAGYPGQASGPYQGGYDSTRSDIQLTNMGDPPSYSQQPQKPREMF